MGLPEQPAAARRAPFCDRARRRRAVEAVRSRRTMRMATKARRAGSARTRAQYAERIAEQVRRLDRRGAGPGLDQAAADAGRHPDPGSQPRRARVADRRAPVLRRACRSRASTGCTCTKPLAVQDLLAAVAFAVQPLDDLNLANLLVSPLIGWDQEQLLELAYGREKAAAVARACASGPARRRDFAAAHDAARRAAGDGRFHDAVAVSWKRSCPARSQGRRKLYCAARAWRRATRSTS